MAQGTDVSGSLRNLASQRTDLFGDESDEAERKRKEEEANKKRKERERIVWDGHTNSAQKTTDTFQAQFTLEDDIDKMHARLGLRYVPLFCSFLSSSFSSTLHSPWHSPREKKSKLTK